MSFLSFIFGNKKKKKLDSTPPIYGGDGLTPETPAIVNCASMGMAQAIIDKYISERCGDDWERGIELTIDNPADDEKSLRMVSVKTPDGEVRFYFDLSRPVSVAMKMFGNT